MKTVYRVIKYEFATQEQLDHQLDKSLDPGTYHTWGTQSIVVVDVPVDSGLGAELCRLTTNVQPVRSWLITRAQVNGEARTKAIEEASRKLN